MLGDPEDVWLSLKLGEMQMMLGPADPVAGELVGDQPEKEKQHQGGEHHLQGKIEFRSGEQDPHRHSAQNDESQNQTDALAGWFHGGLVEWAW